MTTRGLGNDWVAVWRPDALGSGWLRGQQVWRPDEDRLRSHQARVRRRDDGPHPRLVLPLAVLAWAAGLRESPQSAAVLVAGQSVEATLAALPETVTLPLRCSGNGRCDVAVVGSEVRRPADLAEQVAAALTHQAPCDAACTPAMPADLVELWDRRDQRQAGDLALQLLVLLRSAPLAAAEAFAGVGCDEEALASRWGRASFESMGARNLGAWKAYNHYGSRGACPHCGDRVHPAGRLCWLCRQRYPKGPRPRDSQLDRLEVALGVGNALGRSA